MADDTPTRDELGTWVKQELERSQGWESDELSSNREKALEYYLNRPRGDEISGRSEVQSSDVGDMVEAVLAGMVPSFAGDSSVTFEANADDDETQSQLESDVVSQVIMEDNRGFYLIVEALKDALLLKNGIIKVHVEETIETKTQSYEGLSDLEAVAVLEVEDDSTTVELIDREVDSQGKLDLRIRYTSTTQVLKVESVPPENFYTTNNWHSVFLDDIPFCAERFVKSRSELLEMGFDRELVLGLPTHVENRFPNTTRNIANKTNQSTSQQPAQEEIEVFQCYYRVDLDGDNVSELQEIWIAGTGPEIVLSVEERDFIPYGSGSPFINPHRFLGYSLFDRLAGVQDIKTAALRQWLDNAGNNNVNRAEVVEGQVNVDDLENPRPSGNIRVKAPGMYNPIPVNDIGPSMQGLLSYQDKIRGERGGASLDLQSGEAQFAGSQVGSEGVDRIYSTKEQLAGLMTRTLAETLIRTMYLLVHQTMRSQMTGTIRFKRAGDWAETDPSTWPARTRINVKIGLSPNERLRRSSNLEKIMQFQMTAMQSGADGILADLDGVHNTIIDWARSVDIPAPEQYFIDPSSSQAQETIEANARAEQEQAQAQQQAQDQILQLQMQISQANMFSEQWQKLIETQFKYFDAVLKSEVEEAKIIGDTLRGQLQEMQSAGAGAVGKLGVQADTGAGVPAGNGAGAG